MSPSRSRQVASKRRDSAHLFGELVGLALRSTMTCPMELNLRPANVVRRQRARRSVVPFCFWLAPVWFSVCSAGAFIICAQPQVERAASGASASRRSTAMRGWRTQMSNLRKEIAALDARRRPLAQRDQRPQFLACAFWKNSMRVCRRKTFGSRNWCRLPAANRLGVGEAERARNNSCGIAHAVAPADGASTSWQPNR